MGQQLRAEVLTKGSSYHHVRGVEVSTFDGDLTRLPVRYEIA